jgi:hypothetical protein
VYPPILVAVGQAMLNDRRRQAERDSLARTANRARRAKRHESGHRGHAVRAAVRRTRLKDAAA